MARIRSSPRQAPRHTGELYESGYQYQDPDRGVLWLGPWNAVRPTGAVHEPLHTLLHLQNARLDNGLVRTFWHSVELSAGSQPNYVRTLGAATFSMELVTHAHFYEHNTGFLYIEVKAGNITYIRDTTIAIVAGERVQSAGWGANIIYFTYNGVLYKYTLGGAVSTVATAPADAEFLLVLDNNLIVTDRVLNDVWWSVDGSPEDFAGAGSGVHAFLGGSMVGLIEARGSGFVLGHRKTEVIQPTGIGDPAFSFRNIPGLVVFADTEHPAVDVHGGLYFVRPDRSIGLFNRDQVLQPPQLTQLSAKRIFFSAHFDRVVFDRQNAAGGWETWMINPYNNELETLIVSRDTVDAGDSLQDFQPQYPNLRLYSTPEFMQLNLNTEGAADQAIPNMTLPDVSFHRTVFIDQIAVERPKNSDAIGSPDVAIRVRLYNREGSVLQLDPAIVEDGIYARFFINAPCDSLKISTINTALWGAGDHVSRVGVFYSLQERQSAGAI